MAEGGGPMVVEVLELGEWVRFEVRGTMVPEYFVGG